MSSYDIIIVGGGITGLALANMLAPTGLSIALLEARSAPKPWSATDYHARVSAITLSSQRIFQALHVWERIRTCRIQSFRKIHVWDSPGAGEVVFDAHAIAQPALGHIIENNLIQYELAEKLQQYAHVHYFSNITLAQFCEHAQGVEFVTQDGFQYQGKLAIAADGANSWLRQQAGIEIVKKDYEQAAIIATVETALPHQAIASQVFLDTGPLAFLPLADPYVSSIVWSMPTEAAQRAKALDAKDFQRELAQAFAYRLGDVVALEQRYSFPLFKHYAKNYLQSKVVLVGDAAHTIHPMAGQGINMGLLDAASLTDVITAAITNHKGPDQANLRHYQRWRKADNFALLHGIDAIRLLFAYPQQSIQTLRSFGLTMTNQISWIKNKFIHHAVGNRYGLPTLAGKAILQSLWQARD